jgi:hypothetical protein
MRLLTRPDARSQDAIEMGSRMLYSATLAKLIKMNMLPSMPHVRETALRMMIL